MMRLLAALVAMACFTGCRGSQPAPSEQQSTTPIAASATLPPAASASPDASAPPATVAAQRTGVVLFCAYGSQGVLPANTKPEDYYRVILLFEVTTPQGSPTEALPLTTLVLEDAAGKPLSRMRAPISIERPPRTPLTQPWLSALNIHGPPFDDRYEDGIT